MLRGSYFMISKQGSTQVSVSSGASRQAGRFQDPGKLQALLRLNEAVQVRRPRTMPHACLRATDG